MIAFLILTKGFVASLGDPYPTWTSVFNNARQIDGWAESLTAKGYEKQEGIGGEFDQIEVEIWRHKEDGHLHVELRTSANGGFECFFVRPADV